MCLLLSQWHEGCAAASVLERHAGLLQQRLRCLGVLLHFLHVTKEVLDETDWGAFEIFVRPFFWEDYDADDDSYM